MKARVALLAVATLCLECTASGAAPQDDPSAHSRVIATIDARQTAEPVSKYEFGMFIEHLRTLIYRSLWAEMLDDRKFYFPISSKEPETLPQQQAGSQRNMRLRAWRPVGPDQAVTMDKDQPFVGEQSPHIELDSSTPHGIR
jgi:alpha-L-arabinofuranosidase